MTGGRASRTPLQPLELLRVLREHHVDFLVIGGVAVAAHGYVRATKDVDIVPAPERANLERLLAALRALDARPDIGVSVPRNCPSRSTSRAWRTAGTGCSIRATAGST